METIQISKSAYDLLLSKRKGKESLSTIIIREIKASEDEDDSYDVEKLDAHLNHVLENTKTLYDLDEVL